MAFWKKIYKSKYTGREIDAAVGSATRYNIKYTVTPDNDTWAATCDKTYTEIAAAVSAGKLIQFELEIHAAQTFSVFTYDYIVTENGVVTYTVGNFGSDIVYASVLATSEGFDANVVELQKKT